MEINANNKLPWLGIESVCYYMIYFIYGCGKLG